MRGSLASARAVGAALCLTWLTSTQGGCTRTWDLSTSSGGAGGGDPIDAGAGGWTGNGSGGASSGGVSGGEGGGRAGAGGGGGFAWAGSGGRGRGGGGEGGPAGLSGQAGGAGFPNGQGGRPGGTTCPNPQDWSTKWSNNQDDVIFIVGRNPSMAIPFGSDASRITAVTNAIQYVIDKIPVAVNYGYAEYPSRTGCTGMNSCCVSTDGWLRPSNLTMQSERMVSCDGPPSSCLVTNDGRPVTQALGRIPQWLSSATNTRYAILFADGSPGCSGENSGDACTQAIAAITSLRQPATGIKPVVVVVALGDDASKNTCLKMMAQEGGYFDMPPPVQAGDGKTLNAVLTQIVAKPALDYCTINLTSPPDPGSTLQIKAWGFEIDRDTSLKDGWDFNAPGSSRIQIYGDSCRLFQSAPRSEIKISSCPAQGSP